MIGNGTKQELKIAAKAAIGWVARAGTTRTPWPQSCRPTDIALARQTLFPRNGRGSLSEAGSVWMPATKGNETR
jgi:hypothetical protein